MHNNKQKARAQRTRNKLRLTSPFRKPAEQRVQFTRQEHRRQARTTTPVFTSDGCNRFLAVRLEPIPYLEIKPLNVGNIDSISELKSLVDETLGPVFGLANEPTTIKYLAAFGTRMDSLVKGTEAQWCITEINDTEPVIVVFYNHGGLGGWLAPRLSFLPILKRRSERLYRTVLNSFRHMNRQFGMTDPTDWCFIDDWIDQRLEDDEFDTAEEKRVFERAFHDYQEGQARDYFGFVHSSPAMSVEDCLNESRKRIPKDLQPLMKSVIEILELIKEGDAPVNYDIGQAGGFSAGFEQYCDNGELSIDMQFGWRWDDDPIGQMITEYVEDIGNQCGVQPMMSWITIGKEFTYPQKEADLRQAIKALSTDSYPEKFNRVLDNLCFEIEQIYPSKYN